MPALLGDTSPAATNGLTIGWAEVDVGGGISWGGEEVRGT